MASADEIAVLRIELQGIEPLIWRRVAVRAAMSLTGRAPRHSGRDGMARQPFVGV